MRFLTLAAIGAAAYWWLNREEHSDDRSPTASPKPASSPRPTMQPAGESLKTGASGKPKEPAPAKPTKAKAGATPDPVTVGDADDLTRLKGVGPKLSERCRAIGISRFEQIASWNDADVAQVDSDLDLRGRVARDQWVEQAKLLAKGDDAAHKARFG